MKYTYHIVPNEPCVSDFYVVSVIAMSNKHNKPSGFWVSKLSYKLRLYKDNNEMKSICNAINSYAVMSKWQ